MNVKLVPSKNCIYESEISTKYKQAKIFISTQSHS